MKTIGLTSLLLIGCTKSTPNESHTGSASTDDTGSADTETFTVWSGWNHSWALLSHRISLVRVKAGEGGSAESGILGGDWSTGESWSDDVNYRIHQQDVTSSTLTVLHGETSFTVGPEGSATASSLLELDDADVVVLRGFEIDTDLPQSDDYPTDYDPALGYTSRGFGMAVSLDESQVIASSTILWGPRDRADVNSAVPHAQTGVTVYWTAISGLDSKTESRFSDGQELAHTPPNSPQEGMSEPLDWSGMGIAAMTSIQLRITDVDGGDGGDYLRSFGAEIPPSESGEAPSEFSAEILNTSIIELAHMRMDYEVDAIWIPLDPEKNTIMGHTVEGIHPIGSHSVPIEETD